MKNILLLSAFLLISISTIFSQCQASFTYVVNGNTVDFTNTSTTDSSTALFWDYNFGDGQTSGNNDPQHTYIVAGTYYVCLTIADTTCNPTPTLQFCDSVTITQSLPPCQASFTYIQNGSTFDFTNTSTSDSSTASTWQWTFGDGNTSNNNDPQHTYAGPGTYEVCLFIVDFISCPTTPTMVFCDSVTVTGSNPCQASFTYIVNGNTVDFTNTSSTDSATAQQFFYNFGDGQTSTSDDPQHTYAVAGTYYVCLTIVDFACNPNPTMVYCDSVTITQSLPPCQASFTYVQNGSTFGFTNTSTSDSSTASTWQWTFGDGNTSNNNDPQHTYAAPGTYEVCLFIVDFTACPTSPTMVFCDSVTVTGSNPCQASFTYITNGLTVDFTNTSSSDSATSQQFFYDFGDGNFSSSNDPQHTYSTPGTYYVCLLIVDFNCNPNPTMQYCDSITVFATSIAEVNRHSEFILYPNPVSDVVNINFESLVQQPLQFNFYSIVGKLIKSQSIQSVVGDNNVRFNINDWVTGSYIVEVTDEKGIPIKQFKFIK